jgi:hypothetical protein
MTSPVFPPPPATVAPRSFFAGTATKTDRVVERRCPAIREWDPLLAPPGRAENGSACHQDQAASDKEVAMNEARARAMIKAHFDASNVGAAGGGAGDDIVRASEIYAEDAVVEWPQGGERLRGKANIIGFRSRYPARQQFELHRTTGCHDLWVNEYTIRYDDQPVMAVGIMEFRDDKVVRERIYFGEPWKPPAWRAHWVERFDPREPEWPANERQSKKDRST